LAARVAHAIISPPKSRQGVHRDAPFIKSGEEDEQSGDDNGDEGGRQFAIDFPQDQEQGDDAYADP